MSGNRASYLPRFLPRQNSRSCHSIGSCYLPDAIVLVGPGITRNLKEFKFNAGVGGLVVKGDTRADVWTSLRKSLVKPCKAIFTTGPLGEREVPSFFIVGSLADVGTILFIVHPLVGIGCVRQTAMPSHGFMYKVQPYTYKVIDADVSKMDLQEEFSSPSAQVGT